MGRGDELHPALGDGPSGVRVELGADLVDHDHLGHVVLDRLDHDGVLLGGRLYVHSPGLADAGVRYVAIAGDLVRRVHDDDPLVRIVREHAGDLAEHGRLPHARLA